MNQTQIKQFMDLNADDKIRFIVRAKIYQMDEHVIKMLETIEFFMRYDVQSAMFDRVYEFEKNETVGE